MKTSIIRFLGTLVVMVDLLQGSLEAAKCMDGFSEELGSCYSSVHNDTLNWTDADQHCRSLGAHLPYMGSSEEGTLLKSRWNWARLWLGLKINETDDEESLYWEDNTKVDASFFASFSPDDVNRCVVLRKTDMRWELTDCGNKNHVICEADFADDVEATSQSPVVTDPLDHTSRTPALMTTPSQETDFETSTEEEFPQCETLDCLLDLINQDKETEELLQKGIELSNEILEKESNTDPENNPQVDGSEVIEVMQFMDELLPLLLGSFGTNTSVVSHKSRNMVVEARTFSGQCGSISTASSNGLPHNVDLCLDNEKGGRLGMGLSCVRDVNIIYPFGAKTNESYMPLGSCILTLNVIGDGSAPSKSENLTATMTIATRKMDTTNDGSRTCSFWTAATNDSDGYWSDEGCKRAFMNDTHVTCSCDHLTNFAVLVQLSPAKQSLSATDVRILDNLTLAGGIISITCLCLTLTLYACLKVFRNQTIIIHGNLAVSILVSQIIFLTGIDVKNQVACKAVAALLHYFLLSSFSWMMLEGANLYMKATSVFQTTIHMGILFVIGWVFPLIVVGITLAAKFSSYTSSLSCWLNNQNGVIWAFVAPVIFVTACNTCVLVRVIRVFLSLEALANKSDTKKIVAGARAIVLLTPLLGITWLIGLMNINGSVVVLSYVFVILNSSQGVWIFILHCVLNEEVGKAFKLKWAKLRKLHSCKVNPNIDSSSKSGRDSQARNSSRKKKLAWAPSTSTDKTAVMSSVENK
ncbi:uncharacterized protein [Asterias amurensis]|uniref:uncharacterized protein isoform X2 n=1 Tax=Asterias amurensis TaxID=7602 RepID=UPI003AB61A7F